MKLAIRQIRAGDTAPHSPRFVSKYEMLLEQSVFCCDPMRKIMLDVALEKATDFQFNSRKGWPALISGSARWADGQWDNEFAVMFCPFCGEAIILEITVVEEMYFMLEPYIPADEDYV